MASISGKVCWVTGASSGIGEALSIGLNQQGAKVIISARRKEELLRVKQACPAPEQVYVLPLDLSEIDSFRPKVEEAVNAFGNVDILFNNGGISQRSLAWETSLEVDRRLMEINFFGTVSLSKTLLPHFMERKSGHYLVVSSLVGKFGSPLRSSYAASKHALHGFFDSLRAEHHLDNIKVTIACPGFIKTQVSVNALTAKGEKQNVMDDAQANGLSAEACARQIIRAVEKEKEEVNIGGKETLGIYVKRFLPSFFSRIIRKAKVT
jgi:dehydrogenase/reductase SDR family protein 7B